MATLLIIDKITGLGARLREVFAAQGHTVLQSQTLGDGLAKVEKASCDLVWLNAGLNGRQTLEVLPRLLDAPSSPEVIVITEAGDPEEAETAIRKGAWDYLDGSASPETLLFTLNRALQYRSQRLCRKPPAAASSPAFADIVGSSPLLKACLEAAAKAAESDAPVLISGETGTGKELLAVAIHEASARARGNFVVVDCAALPENLVESILFGHEKGAFTGADRAREGLIRHADRGTLFLDEVGELPLTVQKSFLRVLQARRFRRLGSHLESTSNFRVIAATNQNLEAMAAEGRFRPDLLFRLRAFHLELPPLRDRLEDLPELARYQVARVCQDYGLEPKEFSPEFFDSLRRYSWPGNVRELFNALERAVVAARHEPVLFPNHLPTDIRVHITKAPFGGATGTKNEKGLSRSPSTFPRLQEMREAALQELEKQYLRELTALMGRDIKKGCRLSGLSRSRLYHLLKKYQISPHSRTE